jgi:hypothetical protein
LGKMHQPLESAAWRRANAVAARALSGSVMSEVGAATHFQAARSVGVWAGGLARVAQIGEHIFYRFSGRVGVSRMVHAAPEPSSADLAAHADTESGRQHAVFTIAAVAAAPTHADASGAPAAPQAQAQAPAADTKVSLTTPSSAIVKATESAVKAPSALPAAQGALGLTPAGAQPLKAAAPETSKPITATATQS